MLRTSAIAVGIALAASLAASAQTPPAAPIAPPKSPLQAKPGQYTIDPYHTQAAFSWRHFDISTIQGRFNKVTGTLDVDTQNRRASVDVTIDVNSVSTGVDLLDNRLKQAVFFDAAKFPTITFKATDFRFEGDKLNTVVGALTIKGVTKQVPLKVISAVCKDSRNPTMPLPACGANLELPIKRSDYGMDFFAPLVSDEVLIRVNVEAILGKEGIEGQFNGMRPPAR